MRSKEVDSLRQLREAVLAEIVGRGVPAGAGCSSAPGGNFRKTTTLAPARGVPETSVIFPVMTACG
jgi:hypothetical protein